MKIGYIRVSTKEQNTIRQELLMKDLEVEKVYIDKVSGKNASERKQLNEMIEYVRDGDTVVVESISRFARNTKDLLELIEILDNKNVSFISKKEAIDTSTAQGKFMLTVFGAMAELERSYILDRQKEGIEAMLTVDGKKVSSKTGNETGRPVAEYPNNWTEQYSLWKDNKQTAKLTMDNLGLKRTTFYKLVDKLSEVQEVANLSNNTIVNLPKGTIFDLPKVIPDWESKYTTGEKIKMGKNFKSAVSLGKVSGVKLKGLNVNSKHMEYEKI